MKRLTRKANKNIMPKAKRRKCLRRDLAVINGLGLHARAAARIAQTVEKFDCKIMLKKDSLEVEADSVLSILTLDAPMGSNLRVEAYGPEALQALEALEKLFAEGFGENSD